MVAPSASIDDVARLAGVSPTTVSHAISGRRPVSTEVRDRVLEAMEELSYTPRRSARSLATGRTNVLALVVPDISNQYFAELARGVEARALERDYNILLCNSGMDHVRELRYLTMLKSATVDGVIYAAGHPPSDEQLGRALAGLPLVFVDEAIPETHRTVVMSDNRQGGRLAGEHLTGLGHRACLMINVGDGAISADEREAGFVATVKAAGGSVEVDHCANYTYASGCEAIQPYIERVRSGEFTAIFAYNDLVGLGILSCLHRAGLNVPEDVSVVGFDDIPASAFGFPSLTTVRQNVERMGALAAEMLIDSIIADVELKPARTDVAVELIVRESTRGLPSA